MKLCGFYFCNTGLGMAFGAWGGDLGVAGAIFFWGGFNFGDGLMGRWGPVIVVGVGGSVYGALRWFLWGLWVFVGLGVAPSGRGRMWAVSKVESSACARLAFRTLSCW